ncbi:MAG TPA: tetratricopeptide repeat protein [Solirubrobacteraceae bacterium]|jgi:hypothetical protein
MSTADSQTPDEPVLGRVSIGGYCLRVGDPSGASLVPVTSKGKSSPPEYGDSSPLAEALEEERSERESPTATGELEEAVTDASLVTGKVERALTLFREVAEHHLDPSEVSDEVDTLVWLLRKLDHEERFEDVLRVAHSLAMLLGLIGRWLELLRSLESALSAAERLGDTVSKAWVLHELGTLNLAAGRDAAADRMLSEAHELRRQAGDTHGLAITEGNLQVLCRKLRARLHGKPHRSVIEWLIHKPAIALSLAALLLVLGGVVGAVTHGSSTTADTVSNSSASGGKTSAGDGKSTTTGKTVTGKTTTGKTATGKTSSSQQIEPSIGSANTATFKEGTNGTFTVTATGTPKPTITETGRLPSGIAFNGGVLSGLATTNGRFQFVFTATNSTGTSSQSFTLVVVRGRTVTSEEPVTGTVSKPEAPSLRAG